MHHLSCPHCQEQIEVINLNDSNEINCPSCGSSFQLESGSTATQDLDDGNQAIDRFQVIRTLGNGAFGTVYLAYDPQLDRQVAIKVPRRGNLSSQGERDRFLREARSTAQLRHDSIVTVHEVGLHDGNPYLVSDYVRGMTLADLLTDKRLSPRESAELLAVIAAALHHAHEQGVIHRDIKPSNIMLDDNGNPYVMDFGLAKRDVGEVTMTVAGQILGTPAYMSPEQARGASHEVDARSDVYSLGVVLYELLTGTLPFQGNQRMLLHQVGNDDPKPPRKLNNNVPRDLETICLKCMEKEPKQRYASSQELTDDLRRFLTGESIQARPVGQIERMVKWAKRKPAQASLFATLIILFLLLGIGGPIVAFREAQLRHDAEIAEKDALDQKRKATSLAQDLQKSVDSLLTTTARSLGRPLASQDRPSQRPPLFTEMEIDALLELAQTPEEPLRLKFIQELLRNQLTVNQFRTRAHSCLVGVIGMDMTRHDRVKKLCLAHLMQSNLSEEERIDVALIVTRLTPLTPREAQECANVLKGAMIKTWESKKLLSLSQGLSSVILRMEGNNVSQSCSECAQLIIKRMVKTTDSQTLLDLSKGLSAIAPRIEPKKAAQLFIKNISQTANLEAMKELTKHLTMGVQQMEPNEFAQLLIKEMRRTNNSFRLSYLADMLSVVAQRKKNKAVAQVCLEAAQMLTKAMGTTKDVVELWSLSNGLAGVVQHMESNKGASKICSDTALLLMKEMKIAKDPSSLCYLSSGLSTVAQIIQLNEVIQICSEAAGMLIKAMRTTKDVATQVSLSLCLSAVAQRMKPDEAAQILIKEIRKTEEPSLLGSLSDGLTAVVQRIEPDEAAQMLINAKSKITNPIAIAELSRILSLIAQRMEPNVAVRILLKEMGNTAIEETLSSFLKGLSAAAQRMKPDEAAQLLIKEMRKTKNWLHLEYLSDGLSAVVQQMEPNEVGQMIIKEMRNTKNPFHLKCLSDGLSAIVQRKKNKVDDQMYSEAAQLLIKEMRKTKNPIDLRNLAEGLAAVAQRKKNKVDDQMYPEAVQLLIKEMRKTKNPFDLRNLAVGLSAAANGVAIPLGSQLCSESFQILAKEMRKTKELSNLIFLAEGLLNLAQRMNANEAAQMLIKEMRKTKEVSYILSDGLTAVAQRMNANEAAQMLIVEMSKATSDLSRGLQTVLIDSDSENLQRVLTVTASVSRLAGSQYTSTTLPLLTPAFKPLPCRLTTQQLVELLKNPLCVREAERVVLEQLENRYGQKFQTRWDFVKYATEKGLPLDFKSPMKPLKATRLP